MLVSVYQQLRHLSINVLNCDGVVLEMYLDHKFQWPQKGLNRESIEYDVVTLPIRFMA